MVYNWPNVGTLPKPSQGNPYAIWLEYQLGIGSGGAVGAQWAQASPGNSDAQLGVDFHTMRKDDSGNIFYGFIVTNYGPNETPWDLDGGSVGG